MSGRNWSGPRRGTTRGGRPPAGRRPSPRPVWLTEPGGPSAWADMGAARWWVLLGAVAAGLVTGHWLPLAIAALGLVLTAWLIDAVSARW